MTNVKIDIVNQGYESHPDDRVMVYSPANRNHAGQIISTAVKEIPLIDGKATVDLAPGPVAVRLECLGVADTQEKSGYVPETGPVDLWDVVLDWTPALVDQALLLIFAARDGALGDVQESVDAALNSRVDPLEGLRGALRRSLGMASKTRKQVTVLEQDFSQIQGEFAGVTDSRSLMLRALHAATTARKRVLALTEQLNDKPSRGEMQQAISTLTHELSTMEARLNTKLNQKADK